MSAAAHLDHHEQLMQHGKDDDREKMVWSNREQEETNAYVSPGRQTAAQMHKPAVQLGVLDPRISTHGKQESTSKNTQVHNI